MSAEKKDGGGEGERAGTQALGPRSLVLMAVWLRGRLCLQQELGVEAYPLPPSSMLRLAVKTPQPPQAGSLQATAGGRPRVAPAASPVGPGMTESTLAGLRSDIASCRRCVLADVRQGMTVGRGQGKGRLMIVGDFCHQGEPFSSATLFGTAEDDMLARMIRAMALEPDDVLVTNAVKCCPPAGEEPDEACVRTCLPHLQREIGLLRPLVVCAMGEIAARAVLGITEPVARLRGRFHPLIGAGGKGNPIQVMVTFHPRLLLRQEEMKRAVWHDLQMVQRLLQE